MFPAFDSPVPADTIHELEGRDAVCGWAFFSKYKASIKDGHRLENTSWQLWCRELILAPSEGGQAEKAQMKDAWLPKISAASSPQPTPPFLRRNSSVGQIILDIFPPLRSSAILSRSHSFPDSSTRSMLTPLDFWPPWPSSTPVITPVPEELCQETLLSGPHAPTIKLTGPSLSIPATEKLDNPSFLPVSVPVAPAIDSAKLHLEATDAQSEVKTTTGTLTPNLPQHPELKIQVLPHTTPHSPQSSVPQSVTATPTRPTLLPRLVIVQPTPGATPHPTPPTTPRLGPHMVEDSEQMSTNRDLGGLLTPSESSFSGVTDTSLSTVDTMDDTVASVKPSPSAAVARVGAEPCAPEVPAVIEGESTALPHGHTRKSSTSRTTGGESTVQNKTGNAVTSRTRGAARSGGPGRLERTKSQGSSRSRSPGGLARGVGLGGLTMMMTMVVVADSGDPPIGGGHAVDKPKKAGGAMRVVGKRPGLGTRRTLSAGRVVSMGHVAGKGKEKRPAFNIGSNSDEGGGSGSHSKSVGSGSDTGKGVGHMPANLGVPHGPSASLSPMHVDPPAVQPQPRKMVLAANDSEDYETETDSDGVSAGQLRASDLPADKGKSTAAVDQEDTPSDGGVPGEDDGEWASEETGDEDERPAAYKVAGQKPGISGSSGGRAKYQMQIHHLHQQQPQQHYHQRPAAHQANLQQQHPGRHARRLQAEAQARLAKHTVEHAVLEAERLRDMFVRKPVPSPEQLAAMRSKSVGLLTQLLNPDPRIFPVGHPYRRGFSSGG